MKLIRFFGDHNFSLYNLKRSHEIEIDSNNIKTKRMVLAKQIHSDRIRFVVEKHAGSGIIKPSIAGVDGLITNQKNIFLCIKTADCVPIFLWDTHKKVIAALHAGRLGTEKNIVAKALIKMKRHYGCNIGNIKVELGPAVCGSCYDVGHRIFDAFVRKTGVEQKYPYLDLKKVIISHLLEAGIPEENILDHAVCTKDDNEFYSFRKDRTQQRQISLIGMK